MGMTPSEPRDDLRPPGINSDEIATLSAFLDYLREAVAAKLAGVGEEAARRPGVASGTSLLWLVTHLTAVEHNWFVWAYEGVGEAAADDTVPPPAEATVEEVLARYRAAVRRSRETVVRFPDPERPGVRSLRETAPPSMRWTLVHMIEETARHAGHADILREQLDGATGR